MSKSPKRTEPDERSREQSRLDPLWRVLEWPGASGWVGTAFALAALWFGVSALVVRSKEARMSAASPDARAAESRFNPSAKDAIAPRVVRSSPSIFQPDKTGERSIAEFVIEDSWSVEETEPGEGADGAASW